MNAPSRKLFVPGRDFERIPKHWKYRALKDHRIQTAFLPVKSVRTGGEFVRLSKGGWLTVKRGYAWDGASGPTFDTPATLRASLFHDALYQLIGEGLLTLDDAREIADEILERVMLEDGAWPLRAKLWLVAVRAFGWLHV